MVIVGFQGITQSLQFMTDTIVQVKMEGFTDIGVYVVENSK